MSRPESKSSQQDSCPSSTGFNPTISTTPDLPQIDFAKIGGAAPQPLATPKDQLPQADAVVITWASAEWAAMQHVFISGGGQSMPYSERNNHWPGWEEFNQDMPPYQGHDSSSWTYWGLYRLVEIQGRKVLLFKSNTHLDWPGEEYLADMIRLLIRLVQPSLILSIGTAGGSRVADHEGTVSTGNAGVLYVAGQPPSDWPRYGSNWQADWSVVEKLGPLLFAIPTTDDDLNGLVAQYNKFYGSSFTLDQLNPHNVVMADESPKLHNVTPAGTPLLTAATFVVGTTSGDYDQYVCIEMDDAVIAQVCQQQGTQFGFVRNISDPVQNQTLPYCDQKGWGSTIYSVYGFYTSYNGALNAWALLDAQWSQ